jgi:hypothetical protein
VRPNRFFRRQWREIFARCWNQRPRLCSKDVPQMIFRDYRGMSA